MWWRRSLASASLLTGSQLQRAITRVPFPPQQRFEIRQAEPIGRRGSYKRQECDMDVVPKRIDYNPTDISSSSSRWSEHGKSRQELNNKPQTVLCLFHVSTDGPRTSCLLFFLSRKGWWSKRNSEGVILMRIILDKTYDYEKAIKSTKRMGEVFQIILVQDHFLPLPSIRPVCTTRYWSWQFPIASAPLERLTWCFMFPGWLDHWHLLPETLIKAEGSLHQGFCCQKPDQTWPTLDLRQKPI